MRNKNLLRSVFLAISYLFIFSANAQVITASHFMNESWWTAPIALIHDEDINTEWASNQLPGWVMFEYPTANTFNSYSIIQTDQEANGARHPKNWTIQGSNDGTTFTTLDTRTNIAPQVTGEKVTYNFTNTTAYKYYRMNITANNGTWVAVIAELEFYTTSDLTAPTAPAGLSASSLTLTGCTLSWTTESTDNVAVSGYKAYSGTTLLGTKTGTGNSMNITGLVPGTTYPNVTIVAYDALGNISAASNSISVTTTAATTIVITASHFMNESYWVADVANIHDGNIDTEWASNALPGWVMFEYPTATINKSYSIVQTDQEADGARHPKNWTILGSNDGKTFTTLDTKTNIAPQETGAKVTYNFTNTTAYKYYRMRIASNNGTWVAVIAELEFYTTSDLSAPTAPAGLSASSIDITDFTLNWTSESTDNVAVVGYKAYSGTTLLGTKTGTGNSMEITGLVPGTTYSNVTIVAYDGSGNVSGASNSISVTTPVPAPSALYVWASNTSGVEDGTLLHPFKTIQQASDLAGHGTVINIREGVYREQVGITSNGVTFQGYNNEKATIDGTEKISNWTLESGTTYKTTDMNWDFMPEVAGNQLFADKVMINQARWPDQTSTDIVMPSNAIADAVSYSGNYITITCNAFNEPDARWLGAQMYINLSTNFHDGQGWTGTVTAVNSGAHTVTVDFRGTPVTSGPWTVEKGSEFYLFNPLPSAVAASGGVDAMLSAGEWWKDESTLYVKMPNLAAPGNASDTTNIVEAKKRQFAFISSSATQNRSSYTIRNLDLFACAITTDVYFNTRDNQIVEDAHNILIENVNAKYLTHFADHTGNWQVQYSGKCGIILSGRNNIMRNCNIQYSAGPGATVIGYGNKLLNNVIKDCNYTNTNSGAVNFGQKLIDSEIAYNEISNTPAMAIHFGGLQNSTLTNRGVARIHHNKIFDALRRSWDSGAIDMCGQDGQWTRIDHNEIFNTVQDGPSENNRYGIYLDFGKTITEIPANYPGRYIIDHNLVYNVHVPILINHITDVLVYNNTGVLGGDPKIAIVNGNGGRGERDSIVNNIFCGTWNKDSWGNLNSAFKLTNIWDAKDTGVNALTNLFVDPANYDFTLKPTATTAINMGTDVKPYNDIQGATPDLGCFESGVAAWKSGKTDLLPPTLIPGGNTFIDSVSVTCSSEKTGVTYRYTTNGTDPDQTSALYTGPVKLTSNTFLKVRAYLSDGSYSDVSSATYLVNPGIVMRLHEPVTPNGTLSQGLNYEFYAVAHNLTRIPNFNSIEPADIDTVINVNLNKILQQDYFGTRFTGFFDAPKDGVYTFSTMSDDGSNLYIADSLVVNNDRLQAATEKKGMIGLKKGLHNFRLDFWDATGAQILTVSCAGPDMLNQYIPDNLLSHLPYVPYVVTGVSSVSDNSFVLYPNPSSNGNFTMRLPSDFQGKQANLKIYNSIGRMIYNKAINGVNEYSFSGNCCSAPGIYLITIESGMTRKQVKMVVQ